MGCSATTYDLRSHNNERTNDSIKMKDCKWMKCERKTIGSVQWNFIVRTIPSLLTWQNRISNTRIDSSAAVDFLPFQNFYETSNALRRRPLPSSSSIIFYFHSLLLICTHCQWMSVYNYDARILTHLKRILRLRLLHDITHFQPIHFSKGIAIMQ